MFLALFGFRPNIGARPAIGFAALAQVPAIAVASGPDRAMTLFRTAFRAGESNRHGRRQHKARDFR